VQPHDEFFPEFHNLHESQPAGRPGQTSRREWGDQVRALIFDLVRSLDSLGFFN
jgi:hypothetical protein